MPTLVGPFLARAALNCCAITSKASSQDTWVNSPFLSYLPFFLRSSGCVRRSSPYMILERKYPLTQLRPRLTSAWMSPWVATTGLSRTATMTPQPVPQKRHGALDHVRRASSPGRMTFAAAATAGAPKEPQAAAAIAAALAFRHWRRVRSMISRFRLQLWLSRPRRRTPSGDRQERQKRPPPSHGSLP